MVLLHNIYPLLSLQLVYHLYKLFHLKNPQSDLYEANNRIADLLLILGDRDRMINKMSEQLTTPIHDKEWVIKYYERESKNAKD